MRAANSAAPGCLVPEPAFGLDQDDVEVQGLDEGLLDGSIAVNGQNLRRFLQAWLTCLIDMEGKLFRPRWQPEPPNLPDGDWAAFGITRRRSDTFAADLHDSADVGFSEIRRHQELDMLVSFYGEGADANAEALIDGMQVAQNREPLFRQGFGLIEASEPLTVPSLVKSRWQMRVDVNVRLRREISRQYAVLNLTSAAVELRTQDRTTTTQTLLVEQA